jgi:hypothetical protein
MDGLKFPSKKEGAYYLSLKERVKSGEVLFFLMQSPFHLPGGIKYIVDFVEFHSDGTVHFVDVKGYETDKFKLKKRLVEGTYPIEIEVVKKW